MSGKMNTWYQENTIKQSEGQLCPLSHNDCESGWWNLWSRAREISTAIFGQQRPGFYPKIYGADTTLKAKPMIFDLDLDLGPALLIHVFCTPSHHLTNV